MPIFWIIYAITVSFFVCMIHELSAPNIILSTNADGIYIQYIHVNSTLLSEKKTFESGKGPVILKEFGLYERNRLYIILIICRI